MFYTIKKCKMKKILFWCKSDGWQALLKSPPPKITDYTLDSFDYIESEVQL